MPNNICRTINELEFQYHSPLECRDYNQYNA